MLPSKPQWNYCCFLYCCISFVLGFSLGSMGLASESFADVRSMDPYNPSPSSWNTEATTMTTTSTTATNDSVVELKNGKHQKWQELFDYVYELIDAIVGVELWLDPKMTGDVLRKHFQEALVIALGSEPCICEKQEDPSTNKCLPEVQQDENENVQQQKLKEQLKRRLPDSVDYLSGVGRVDRTDFSTLIDTGVPLHLTDPHQKDVLIVYGPESTLPPGPTVVTDAVHSGTDNRIPTEQAIQNCEQLSIIHLKDTNTETKNCWAFVPGQESFHVQKWLRVSTSNGAKVNLEMPFRLVPRGYEATGYAYPTMPSAHQSKQHRIWLGEYFLHVDSLVAQLTPIIKQIAVDNQVVFTVVNAGQSKLLLNFACAAKSRGLDISRILVFVLDETSRDLVQGLGMVAFYDRKFFGALPSSTGNWATKRFASVVTAKMIGAHLLSLTGYDFLVQDVDVIWYKDPLTFFKGQSKNFDIYFQDDLNERIRFQPWRGNSGLYFVRNNQRTRLLMKDFVMRTDHLMANYGDQQTLSEVIAEHVSLWGLRVKIFDGDDTAYFPCGGHYNMKRDFMKKLIAGQLDDEVYVFHMNWNKNKTEKIAYMRQMGYWFVKDDCMDQSFNSSTHSRASFKESHKDNVSIGETCCSAEALFSCQFRDKPSIKPCKESPASSRGKRSWW